MAFTTTTGLRVYRRADWNARPSRGSVPAGPLFHAGIHHGGPVGAPRMTKAAAAATCRSWQNYHMDTHGWNDIGYNLLIDGLGRLYEGRPVGTLAAGVGGHNTGGVHINFMQDGREYGLNVAQRRTLKVLFEHGIPRLGLPALKKFSTSPKRYHGVYGHREYTWGTSHAGNECPGEKILTHLKWRRAQYR